jgi:hypothetical protein
VRTAAKGIIVCLVTAAAASCTSAGETAGGDDPGSSGSAPEGSSTSSTPPPTSDPGGSGEPTSQPTETGASGSPGDLARFDSSAAMRTIRFLADDIGPREATSGEFRRAAQWVEREFEASGYTVQRQRLRVPAGNSWGVDVPEGATWNVVATKPGFDASDAHLVVGAHLDTVPQAPGAEDNASGVSVVLELARLSSVQETRLPVVFVAFAAEEPRGDGDALHHFGSTAMVDRLSGAEQRATRAMVSLDRIGVGTVVPVCTGGLGPPGVRAALLRVAERLEIPASRCLNTSSDHWSFEKAGMRAARVGGTSYAGYHSAGDVPSVVDPAQVQRVGRLMWGWLQA